MLMLPDEWRSWTGGAVVKSLMDQASSQSLQTEVARHFILASFELLQRQYANNGKPPVRIAAVSTLEWRIGDYRFAYVPVVNDDVAYRWAEALRQSSCVLLIVLPGHDRVLFHSLNELLEESAPMVMGLDCYVDFRTLMAMMAFHRSQDRVNLELIETYNRCAAKSQAEPLIRIAFREGPRDS